MQVVSIEQLFNGLDNIKCSTMIKQLILLPYRQYQFVKMYILR